MKKKKMSTTKKAGLAVLALSLTLGVGMGGAYGFFQAQSITKKNNFAIVAGDSNADPNAPGKDGKHPSVYVVEPHWAFYDKTSAVDTEFHIPEGSDGTADDKYDAVGRISDGTKEMDLSKDSIVQTLERLSHVYQIKALPRSVSRFGKISPII